MMRHRMANFMSQDSSQACIIPRDRQQTCVHPDFAARQAKGIGLLAFKNHKLPLSVWKVLARHLCYPAAYPLHLRIQGSVIDHGIDDGCRQEDGGGIGRDVTTS